jgi:hypothetical protein
LAQGKEIDFREVLPLVCMDDLNGISRGGRNRDFKLFRMLQRIFDSKTKKVARGTKFLNLNLPSKITTAVKSNTGKCSTDKRETVNRVPERTKPLVTTRCRSYENIKIGL